MKFTSITPGNAAYEDWNNRGVNLRFKGQPSGIIPVANVEELSDALQYAVDNRLLPAVRGGGHCLENFVSNPEVNLVIDLSNLKGIRFDAEMGAIEIMAGSTLGEIYERLHKEWGVVLPAGEHPAIGIGGHIPGGAFGFLCRQHGLGADYLYAVELLWVNKDRQVEKLLATRRDSDPNRELWWAHTGGGAGNFGIVTRYWFRAENSRDKEPSHLLPPSPGSVETIELDWSWKDMTEHRFRLLVDNFCNWTRDHAQPGASGLTLFATLHLWNRLIGKIQLKGISTGPSYEIPDAFIQSLNRELGISCTIKRQKMSWLDFALHPFPDIFTPGKAAFKVKDAFLCQPFTHQQIKTMHHYLTEWPEIPGSMLGLATYGGQVNTVASDATASSQRNAIMATACTVGWLNPEEEAKSMEWVRKCYQDLYQDTGGVPVPGKHTGGCIIAHPDNDMADPTWNASGLPWHRFYYQDNYPRLQQVKAAWDPCTIFKHRLSVEPA